eukprot:TRINITY_DN20300_c0_g1_i1.p1 TRINITY_DN20300_c0_g1~~TRINITY_DN20300_c0_g1_i1.p1  ORF type:complete len:392 (-),score=31.19 TRINITY_DN20300_c0_g1_i1:51-1226(-)
MAAVSAAATAGEISKLGTASGQLNPFHVLINLFGCVTSLGQVYNDAQCYGVRCAALACVVSAYSVSQHYRYNAYPQIRRSIIVILVLIPVYALDATLGLYKTSFHIPSRVLREAYEAYTLLAFMRLVLVCLGKVPGGLSRRWSGKFQFPIWSQVPQNDESADSALLGSLHAGVCQYALLCGMVTPSIALIAWYNGHFHEGNFSFSDAYPYCSAVQFVSQSWALYCLVQLLHQARSQLEPVRPVIKFMCIKFLIFATWMQSVAILILENLSSLGRVSLWIETQHEQRIRHWWDPTGLFDGSETVTRQEDMWHRSDVRGYVGSGLGSFLLCVEMLAFAVMHRYAYPSSEWDPKDPKCAASQLVLLRPSTDPGSSVPLLKPSNRTSVVATNENV